MRMHIPRFLSYSQNLEDVRLRRVFPHDDGFFIDVGAADPIQLSVTKALSKLGWRGINLEPQSFYFERLQADRPNDINLNIGLSDRPGQVTFYESPSHRGFSTLDPTVAAQWSGQGIETRMISVPTTTLEEVCKQHASSRIDFLKVDVEGHERSVLLGGDFQKYRPIVVVVEATEQNSKTTNHESWEPILLKSDYLYAAFDGVNRFYVRRENRELVEAIAIPPNSFDDYGFATVWDHVEELIQKRQELYGAIEHLQASLAHAQNAANHSWSSRLKSIFKRKAA